MEFGLLGDVWVTVDGQPVDVGYPKQRSVLVALLVEANRTVSVDQLVDRVWGDRPPGSARGTLLTYLSRLRQILAAAGAADLARRPGGYVLTVNAVAVDLHRFRGLLTTARGTEDDDRAVALYDEALQLWRGEPFAGLDTPWLAGERSRLERERLAAQLDRTDLLLRRGHHAELLAELSALVDAHPLDERLAGQYLLALYRSGRQADALDHYQQIQLRLSDELGADPSPVLQRVFERILTADPALTPAGAAVPRQLPSASRLFTGRDAELAQLDRVLNASGDAGGGPAIAVIAGSGGIGKTWLALRWSHHNLDRFPDGQLYANLRGFDPSGEPVPPAVAVRDFLTGLGVAPAAVPLDLDAQTALYRTLVAGQRLLVVLDNVRDTADVTPLLPGSATCTVVVTSRNHLSGLATAHGAHSLELGVLDATAARRLLTRHVGAGAVAAEPGSVATLLDCCAGLPLALAIVAARVRARPDFGLSVLADELRSSRLDALDAGELTANLRAVFSWSTATLGVDAARLFRLLGVHAGPDISTAAAASLAGTSVGQVRPLLAELVRAHLVNEHTPGRFASHDLLRAYAGDQAHTIDTRTERRGALRRALDHYLHTAHTAAMHLYPHRHPITVSPPDPAAEPVDITDLDQALAWFTAEHPVLVAMVRSAADTGYRTHAWQLAWALVDYFDRRGHWHDQITTQQKALTAAREAGDRSGQGHAHRGLARVMTRLGRYEDAHVHFSHALNLFGALGDNVGRARTHHGLGWMLGLRGRHRDALAHEQRALDLYQAAGNQAGLVIALNGVGWCHAQLGDYHQALNYCERALSGYRALGHRHGQAAAWDSLGYAHHHLGYPRAAITCYLRAIELYREVGDRYNEADTLVHLGDSYHATDDAAGTRLAWETALDILDDLGLDAAAVRTRIRQISYNT